MYAGENLAVDFTESTDIENAWLASPKHRDNICLLYTSDAADERSSVDLGGRRIIKKKKKNKHDRRTIDHKKKHKEALARVGRLRWTARSTRCSRHVRTQR